MLIILICSLWGVFFYHQEVITLQVRVSCGTQNTFSETWELKGLSSNIHLSGYVHIFKRTRSSETRKQCSFVREFCFGSFSNSSWSIPSHIFIVNGKHDWQKAMSWTPVLTESHRSLCILDAIAGKVCRLAENWNFAHTDHVLSSYKFNLLTIDILHLEARRWSCLKTE